MPLRPTSRPFATIALGVLAAFGVLVGCNSDSEVAPLGDKGFSLSSSGNSKRKETKKRKGKKGSLETDEANGLSGDDDDGGDDDDDDQGDVEEPEVKLDYPSFKYRARGSTTCKGDTYPTGTQIQTSLDDKKMIIDMIAARIECGGKCNDKANKEIQKSVAMTTYARTPRSDRKKSDFQDAEFAIFGSSVLKQPKNGGGDTTFQFDSPLPVFPWPSPPAAYKKLNDGPMTWTAHVTGGPRNFTAEVTITKVSEDGNEIVLEFLLTIPEDRGGHGWYEDFPMARRSVYRINTDTRDVQQIVVTSWFNGDKCGNQAEQVQLTYKVCQKTKDGNTESFPCQ
jgi:hypothetical protein